MTKRDHPRRRTGPPAHLRHGGPQRRGSASDTLPDVRVARAGVRVDVADLVALRPRVPAVPVGGTLPLTYPHLLAFPLQMAVMSGRPLPAPAPRCRPRREPHRGHPRPIAVDEPLDVSVWAQDLRPHRRGAQVDLVSEVERRGEVVWRGVSTYLSRGTEHPDARRPSRRRSRRSPPCTAGRCGACGEGTGRAYAAVSGDWNPIHVHALTARPLGFPSAIAHGMYTYARASRPSVPRCREEGLTSRVWFRKPVRLPVDRAAAHRLRGSLHPVGPRVAEGRHRARGRREHLDVKAAHDVWCSFAIR